MARATIAKGNMVSVRPEQRRGRRDSEGGVGFVKKKKRRTNHGAVVSLTQDSAASGQSLFDVKYLVSGGLSQDIERDRISVAMLGATARPRHDGELGPSLLSRLPTTRQQQPVERPAAIVQTKYSTAWFVSTANQKERGTKERMTIAALRDKKKRDVSGWLRNLEHDIDPKSAPPNFISSGVKPKVHLTDKERDKAMKLLLLAKPHVCAIMLVSYAWGVDRKTLESWEKKMLCHGSLRVERKPRSDTGLTLINSEKKRRSVFTAKCVFTKNLRADNPDMKFQQKDIDAAWVSADAATKNECSEIADEWLQQGPFLLEELRKALQATGGSVSWRTVATLVSGSGNLEIIGKTAIQTFTMTLPDSTYVSTRILPLLNQANKKRRLWWSHEWWIFWRSAVSFNQVQMLLVHMDEKWFWAIVVRRNLKCIPFLEVEPVQHGVHHKSHLDKIMGIASTAYAPNGNDFSKGGTSFLVNLVRVGRMMAAARDTYKRVYRDDGTYHYPRIAENRLRIKGNLYFKGMEVTGSNKGTDAVPKFDLVSYFRDTEIPRLDELCIQVGAMTGKRVAVRYQMDGAGPHVDKGLQSFLQDEFRDRKWQLKYQSSNSPVCNVKDDCIFPALSKHISREQGISKGSNVFEPDELWAAVVKCWKAFPLDALARAYVRHSQIVSAIAECQGGDDFVREKGGLHCQVRNCCMTVCDNNGKPIGVEMVSCFDSEEDDTDAPVVTAIPQLRYKQPDVERDLEQKLMRMTASELECMFEEMPVGHEWMGMIAIAYDNLSGAASETEE